MRIKLLPLFAISLIVAGIIACDVTADENFDFKQGDSLAIIGPAEVTIPQDTTTSDTTDVTEATASYYVRAFTVKKDYSWSLGEGNGARQDSVYREGEYMDVTFTKPGTYTINIDDGEYQGSVEVTANRQPNSDL